MTDKNKLIQLLKHDTCKSPYICDSNCKYASLQSCYEERIADNLIENGVIVTPETGIGDLSDGYHTFNELYHHRAILFSVICSIFKDKAWKSKKHHDGTMYDGMFIVGIDTPKGQATYHYDIDPYWDIFQVKELSNAPEWDGHTPDEAIDRISTLTDINVITLPCNVGDKYYTIDKYCTENGYYDDYKISSYSDCENCTERHCDKQYRITERKFYSLSDIMQKQKGFGNYYFLTEKEARERLKEIKNK